MSKTLVGYELAIPEQPPVEVFYYSKFPDVTLILTGDSDGIPMRELEVDE